CFSELTIPQEEIYIEEGKTLKINFTASEDIDFFYPKTIKDQIVTSPVEFIVETALNSSKFILKRSNTVFGDTGWYGWIEASKNQRKLNLRNILVTPYSYNEIDIHWVYVYVKSKKKSLTSTSQMYHIKSPVGSDVNFPCYPTSPDYNVTLSYLERRYRRTVIMPVSEKLSYHRKKGFTLHNVNINDERKYLCDVPPPHKTNFVLINLRVKDETSENSLEISSRPLQQITVAEDFSMNCTIRTEKSYSYDTFRWITPLQVVYSPENISYSVSGDEHFSRFEHRKTVYSDSGWYGCAIVSEKYKKINQDRILLTPDIYGELGVQWIYVFVKSTEHLFLDLPIHQNSAGEFLLESSGSDVTLPCRPTSSKYQVQLYAIEKEKTEEINISDETDSLVYDVKKGFIFENFKADSASFGCAIIKNGKQKRNLTIFRVTSTDESKKGDVPTITTFSLTHMEIGKNFSMNCTVSFYEDREYFVQWVTPQLNNRTKETEYRITKNKNLLSANGKRLPQILNLELTIENVTTEDYGEYECFVYQYSKVESARINLVPHQHKHLDLSLKSLESGYVKDFGNHAKLIISVDAYPLPKFNWYNPKGLEIDYQRRFFDYQINGETFSIDLSSRELTHDDTGTHTLIAYNSEFKNTISFNVSILEPPSSVEEENLYMTNEKVRLQCQAKGYPVPTIMWQYADEFDKLIGTSMSSNLFQNISTIVTDGLVTSIIIVKVMKEGFVSCVANNTMGEKVIKKQRIKFAEQPSISNELFEPDKSVKFKAESHHHDYLFGIMNQNINVTEGDAVEMHCSASIDSYPNRILWYNNSNSLRTNGRVAIDESKAASLYTSKLFITNITKWDEGNYTCKGITNEGGFMTNQYQLFLNAIVTNLILPIQFRPS
ncbi:hypothetical protein KQX54_006570, partial [Cotesia glomerata]